MIREYRDRFPSFPHQSTADQFFDEDQFEAYRALGQHVAEEVLPRPAARTHDSATMSSDEFHEWFESLTASNDSGSTTREREGDVTAKRSQHVWREDEAPT